MLAAGMLNWKKSKNESKFDRMSKATLTCRNTRLYTLNFLLKSKVTFPSNFC